MLRVGLSAMYPGPHGLGLIEGPPLRGPAGHQRSRIPGRMAWASLKVGDLPFRPKSLLGVSRAAWPGPH